MYRISYFARCNRSSIKEKAYCTTQLTQKNTKKNMKNRDRELEKTWTKTNIVKVCFKCFSGLEGIIIIITCRLVLTEVTRSFSALLVTITPSQRPQFYNIKKKLRSLRIFKDILRCIRAIYKQSGQNIRSFEQHTTRGRSTRTCSSL